MPKRRNEPQTFDEGVCTVKVWRDKKTGIVIMEEWRDENKRLHRFDGPAYLMRDPETEIWAVHGKNHRDGAQAVLSRDRKTGRVMFSEWHTHGQKVPDPRRSPAKNKGTSPSPS
jgi:hypothetical protein